MTVDKKRLLLWIVGGLLGLFLFVTNYDATRTEASVNLRISKEQATAIADKFIAQQGFSPQGYRRTVVFVGDSTLYLQKVLGMKRTNELLQKGTIPCWAWDVRYAKELEKEGFRVGVDTGSGKVVHFDHFQMEDAKSENLTQDKARAIAEKILLSQGENIKEYNLRKNDTTGLKNRTDHSFTWIHKNFNAGEAELQIYIAIDGDKLGAYAKYLDIPESFVRSFQEKQTPGTMLSFASGCFTFFLFIAALYCLLGPYRKRRIRWPFALWLAALPLPFLILDFINELPSFFHAYKTTASYKVYFFFGIGFTVVGAVVVFALILLFTAAGELMSRILHHKSFPIIYGILRGRVTYAEILPRLVVGYSFALWWLGYVTVFYLITINFGGVWKPMFPGYSQALTTSMPFLYPLTIAITAALGEELFFRLFGISFFRKFGSKLWFALLIPAMVWAFGHSDYPVYPMYVRGIELTTIGVMLGIIYLRYGIETVIISHFVYNAILVGLPLLRSHNTYFVISGFIVIFIIIIPALLLPLFVRFRKKRTKPLRS